MKKIIKILLGVLIVILIKLVGTFIINGIIIFNYNNHIYNSLLVKSLYFLNVSEPYIAYYNEGNIMYQKKDYDGAIKKYKEVISKKPPQKRICDVRINLSLALIRNISNYKDYNSAYNTLEEARYNLYKDDCASATDDSGNSKEAEELEEIIKELENELNNGSSTIDNTNNNEEEGNDEKEEDSDIEEELKEQGKESNASRQEELDLYNNINSDYNYNDKNW